MISADAWLRARVRGVPPRLVERMAAAVPDDALSVPLALAEGALTLYRAVASGTGGREDALPLLAADALLTHAFEAQAELDPARIDELVAVCGRRLGEVLR